MSALDDIVNPKNWEFEQNSGGVVWMFTNYARPTQAAIELAQLRLELESHKFATQSMISSVEKYHKDAEVELAKKEAELKLCYEIADNNQKAYDHIENTCNEMFAVLKDAVQFVAKWTNDHDSEIGHRVVERMEIIIHPPSSKSEEE